LKLWSITCHMKSHSII